MRAKGENTSVARVNVEDRESRVRVKGESNSVVRVEGEGTSVVRIEDIDGVDGDDFVINELEIGT